MDVPQRGTNMGNTRLGIHRIFPEGKGDSKTLPFILDSRLWASP